MASAKHNSFVPSSELLDLAQRGIVPDRRLLEVFVLWDHDSQGGPPTKAKTRPSRMAKIQNEEVRGDGQMHVVSVKGQSR